MRHEISSGFAALVALLVCAVALTGPGCSSTKPTSDQTINGYAEKLREAVFANVPEHGPRAQMLSIVDQVESVHLRFSRETANFIESYRTLNADYDSTRPALSASAGSAARSARPSTCARTKAR